MFAFVLFLWVYIIPCCFANTIDEFWIQRAANLCLSVKQSFCAVIVDCSGRELCSGVNTALANPTFHGEMVAINNCSAMYGGSILKWSNLTLYSTAEPCPMCMSAAIWAHFDRVVWGTTMSTLQRAMDNQINISAAAVLKQAPNGIECGVRGGVLHNVTDPLFQPPYCPYCHPHAGGD